ncbi:MAG TPA: nucleotide exchange factor GrpE [Candidatus Diapherotrites archaeon]|nr:nucleotide exchange factor GrpE [Candidatus Diapherotrites archaeon]
MENKKHNFSKEKEQSTSSPSSDASQTVNQKDPSVHPIPNNVSNNSDKENKSEQTKENNVNDTKENKSEPTEQLSKDNKENNVIENNQNLSKEKEYLDLLQRVTADFDNYKKRMSKQLDLIVFTETSKFINSFLEFYEVLKKAVIHEQNQETKNNLSQLQTLFENVLKKQNIEKIDVLNKDFDYNTSECIETRDVDDKTLNNKIIEVIEDGFLYNNKLIKPAKVVVGKYLDNNDLKK